MTKENEQRMERLFHDHYEQMYRFAFALLHDNEEARDVVSDVFSRLWDKQLVPDQAYLMRSVKNACINLIARREGSSSVNFSSSLGREIDGGRTFSSGRAMAGCGGLHRP